MELEQRGTPMNWWMISYDWSSLYLNPIKLKYSPAKPESHLQSGKRTDTFTRLLFERPNLNFLCCTVYLASVNVNLHRAQWKLLVSPSIVHFSGTWVITPLCKHKLNSTTFNKESYQDDVCMVKLKLWSKWMCTHEVSSTTEESYWSSVLILKFLAVVMKWSNKQQLHQQAIF